MLEEYTMEETKQQQGRSPDSLIQAIDRIERLEKQLKIAREGISGALDFLACPDDLTECAGKCNEQLAFDCLVKTEKRIEELEK